jgi:hypothetical protein
MRQVLVEIYREAVHQRLADALVEQENVIAVGITFRLRIRGPAHELLNGTRRVPVNLVVHYQGRSLRVRLMRTHAGFGRHFDLRVRCFLAADCDLNSILLTSNRNC